MQPRHGYPRWVSHAIRSSAMVAGRRNTPGCAGRVARTRTPADALPAGSINSSEDVNQLTYEVLAGEGLQCSRAGAGVPAAGRREP